MGFLTRPDATDLAHSLREGQVSSVDLVRHHLRVIDENAQLGAFLHVDHELALHEASVADRRLAEGDPAPFLGVPTAFKDLTPTADTVTTFGSAAMRDHRPERDAHVVTLVRAAGFVSLGKTNTPELGLSSFTDNDLVGPAVVPSHPTRNAGGSSGGAAAAVAAGLLPLAPGSDGGGSIRIPASACGIFGFKPSRGRVSSGPGGLDWSGLAVDGALTRTVRDAAALMDVLAVPMPGDIRPLPPPSAPFASVLGRDLGRLRVARWTGTHLPGVEPSQDAVDACDTAHRALVEAGHEVVEIGNPFPRELETRFNVVWSSSVAAAPIPPEAEPLLRPTTRYWRQRGRDASAVDLASALGYLEQATREVVTALGPFDAMLTPTLALPAQPTTWFTGPTDPVEIHRRELLFTPYTALYNMTGQPAASLPVHCTADGLPMGAMLAARAGRDDVLLALCAQLEPYFLTVPLDEEQNVSGV